MRYVIVAPAYNEKTAGIKVLQELQKWLIRSGKDAIIPNIDINMPYHIEDDDIVVYPEIIRGNPLKAKRVVRYILNEPGKLGGDKEYDKDEILVAYDPAHEKYSNGISLTVPIFEDFMINKGCERTVDCYWVGKGKDTKHPITDNCIEITYSWPAKRRELAELLNRTRILYSYDDRTYLLTEAARCGCEIKLIVNDEIVPYTHEHVNMDWFKICLDRFIEITWYPEIDVQGDAERYISTVITKYLQPRAEALLADGRYDEALLAIEEIPPSTDPLLKYEIEARCHCALGNDELALHSALKAGNRPQALVVMGTLAARRGEMVGAEEYFRRAIESDPAFGKAWLSLGMLLWGNGDREGAYQAVRQAVAVEPLNGDAVSIERDMAERLG